MEIDTLYKDEKVYLRLFQSIKAKVKPATLLFIYTLLVLTIGSILFNFVLNSQTYANIKKLLVDPPHIFSYLNSLVNNNAEKISIDIKYEDNQKLRYQWDQSLRLGISTFSDADFVSANITYKNEVIEVDMRIKGDIPSKAFGEKLPFRIEVKGDKTLFGMRRFSLHHPMARGYLDEWIFHKLLKSEEIMSLRYDFIDVTLNGKDLGIYALEEHFDRLLIENNKRREGVIIAVNEDLDIRSSAYTGRRVSYEIPEIQVYNQKRIIADQTLNDQFDTAKNLLESYRKKILPLCKVFDCPILARYFSLVDMTHANHAAKYGDFKLYYNPVTSTLEPIGFDAEINQSRPFFAEKWQNYTRLPGSELLISSIFSDQEFISLYIKEVEKYTEKNYLDNFFNENDKEIRQKLQILYGDYILYHFSPSLFYDSQNELRSIVSPLKGVNAYYQQNDKNNLIIDVGNILSLPIEIVSIVIGDNIEIYPNNIKVLNARSFEEAISYISTDFSFPINFIWQDDMKNNLKLKYKLLGSTKLMSDPIIPWRYFDAGVLENNVITQNYTYKDFPFISVDEKEKVIFVNKGKWEINKDLIIPKGYRVIVSEGIEINLLNLASIISYSPLEFKGNEENPIKIFSSDASGQGLVILNAGDKSFLRYTVFDNLSNPSKKGWELTGSVTAYESPIVIQNSSFINSRSEDALNIIRSSFIINNSNFNKIKSDALDSDFSTGEISDSLFSSTGNDALDFSGSVVKLTNISTEAIGDKVISAGENSEVIVDGLNINDCFLGPTSKDRSNLKVNKVQIFNCKIKFAVYQKKSEFGPSSLEVTEITQDDKGAFYFLENKSKLKIDKIDYSSSENNIYEKIYGQNNPEN